MSAHRNREESPHREVERRPRGKQTFFRPFRMRLPAPLSFEALHEPWLLLSLPPPPPLLLLQLLLTLLPSSSSLSLPSSCCGVLRAVAACFAFASPRLDGSCLGFACCSISFARSSFFAASLKIRAFSLTLSLYLMVSKSTAAAANPFTAPGGNAFNSGMRGSFSRHN
jgi:hypothetical protein